jgi:hypothetical protein
MVWPARRIWAVRAVELLVALILSKFAIVAVLSLGGAALSESAEQLSVTGIMAGAVLITLAAFSPWAMVRLLPLAEVASGAAGSLRGELRQGDAAAGSAQARAVMADDWAQAATARMRRDAGDAAPDPGPSRHTGGDDPGAPPTDEGPGGPPKDPGPPDEPGRPPDEPSGPPDEHTGPPDEPTEGPDLDWASMPALELGPENLLSTPVYPHEDAS